MADAGPIPIRPGVEPQIDGAREMRDWAWTQIEEHMRQFDGVAPDSIALVLLGRDKDGRHSHSVNTWSPANEMESRLMVASAAGNLLNRRALD